MIGANHRTLRATYAVSDMRHTRHFFLAQPPAAVHICCWRFFPILEGELKGYGTVLKMTIRDFSPSDVDLCLEIRRQAFTDVFRDELGADGVRAGLSAYGPSGLIRLSEGGKSFVADDDGPIGFCTIQRKDSITADLLLVYVKLNRLKQGFGTALVEHAEEWMSSHWTDVAWFDVETVIPKYNRGFYERLGFRSVGKTQVEFPGKVVQALHLRRQISKPLNATSNSDK